MTAPNTPSVMGYLAGNWPACNTDTPALVLNPEAQPLDLLAWCWAELVSLTATAGAFVTADPAECGEAMGPVFLQRLPALRDVLEHAVNRLYGERRALRDGQA